MKRTDYISKLIEAQRKKSEKQYEGMSSYVTYLHGKDKIAIEQYQELTPYCSQLNDEDSVFVSFMASEKRLIKFSTSVTERKEDRKSFENNGGLIYIFEPLTQEIAKELLKTKMFNS